MFGETRFVIPYFQQMTFCSKILKIIDTLLQNNSYSASIYSKIIDTQFQNNSHSISFLEYSVNYCGNFGAHCHLLKIWSNENMV